MFILLNWSKFSWSKRRFVLSFRNTTDRTGQTKYCIPTVGVKDYNAIIDRQKFSIK